MNSIYRPYRDDLPQPVCVAPAHVKGPGTITYHIQGLLGASLHLAIRADSRDQRQETLPLTTYRGCSGRPSTLPSELTRAISDRRLCVGGDSHGWILVI